MIVFSYAAEAGDGRQCLLFPYRLARWYFPHRNWARPLAGKEISKVRRRGSMPVMYHGNQGGRREGKRRGVSSEGWTMGLTTRHQSGATQAHCLCAGKRSFTWRAGLTLFDDRPGLLCSKTPSSSSRLRHYSPPDDDPQLYIRQEWRDTPSFSPVRNHPVKKNQIRG